VPYSFDPDIYQQLIDGGVDDLLAKHYSHLFIRDPLVIYEELLHQDNGTSSDHFEVRAVDVEHTVNELADNEIQASPTQFQYRMESRV
jgi:Glutamate-cysteine ligase